MTSTVTYCYRHPGRETWVACTRCDRPICPDCMNPASVGFHCPECVAEGQRSARAPQTAVGGNLSGQLGTVTKTLIGINVGVWVLGFVAALLEGASASDLGRLVVSGQLTDFVRWGAAVPVGINPDGEVTGIATGELWRLVTAGFFHNGIMHLALNMFGLWILGNYCEEFLGRWRYLALYLLSGVGGTVAILLFGDPNTYAVGASASIFGLMAALFFFLRKQRLDTRAIVVLLVLNLGIGLFIPGISMLGHIGGMVVGGVVGALFTYAPSGPSRVTVQISGLVIVVGILTVVTIARIAQYGLL